MTYPDEIEVAGLRRALTREKKSVLRLMALKVEHDTHTGPASPELIAALVDDVCPYQHARRMK